MTMSAEAIREACEQFQRVRAGGAPLAGLPESCRPQSAEDGYAIQEAFIEACGQALAGWKIGATGRASQELFGVSEPFYGPVLASVVFSSPAELPAADFAVRGIESEFAFRLAADFAPREQPYEADEVAERVSAPVPAIEIVCPRLDHPIKHGVATAIADCGVNGALVLGAATLEWQEIDLANHEVRLLIDGEQKAAGTGALVLGHPLNALTWFVNRYTAGGRTLPASQIVSTGTTTGIVMLEPGQTAVADFGALGQISVRFD